MLDYEKQLEKQNEQLQERLAEAELAREHFNAFYDRVQFVLREKHRNVINSKQRAVVGHLWKELFGNTEML